MESVPDLYSSVVFCHVDRIHLKKTRSGSRSNQVCWWVVVVVDDDDVQ